MLPVNSRKLGNLARGHEKLRARFAFPAKGGMLLFGVFSSVTANRAFRFGCVFPGCESWLIACALTMGCARATAPAKTASAPTTLSVPRTVVTAQEAVSIPELYQRAQKEADAGDHASAARDFGRVAELDPKGELAEQALFSSAAEYDEASDFEHAASNYEQLFRRNPQSRWSTLALVRATRLRAHLEQWASAGETAQRLLDPARQVGPFEAVLVFGALALARLDADDERAAESFIEKGRALIDDRGLDAAGRLSRDLAPLYFSLGELRRRRAERVVFVPPPANFGVVLEQRCQLLLDAQSAYSDAMRAYDAHWSAMAGFRVGELYASLHRDLMQVSPPASADTLEKKQLFEGAMRLRYAILLEKAEHMLEHTLSMASRTGEQSVWVERSRETMTSIHEASEREQAAIAALPFSRSVLEAALADLSKKTEEKERRESQKRGGKGN